MAEEASRSIQLEVMPRRVIFWINFVTMAIPLAEGSLFLSV